MGDNVKIFMQIIFIKTADYISFRVWHKSDTQKSISQLPPHIKPNLLKIPIHLWITKRRKLRLLGRQFYSLTIAFIAITG